MIQKARSGFTLAELLIALALLGLVAAFTIPKIMNATGSAQTAAKVKDAVSTIEQTWYSVKMQNQYCGAGNCTAGPGGTGAATLFDEIVANPSTTAPINYTASGIGPAPGGCNGATGGPYKGYVQLANGIIIAGLAGAGGGQTAAENVPPDFGATETTANNYVLCIDTNPTSATHTEGSNIFYANFNPIGSLTAAYGTASPSNANNKNFLYTGVMAAGAPGGNAFSTPNAAVGSLLN